MNVAIKSLPNYGTALQSTSIIVIHFARNINALIVPLSVDYWVRKLITSSKKPEITMRSTIEESDNRVERAQLSSQNAAVTTDARMSH